MARTQFLQRQQNQLINNLLDDVGSKLPLSQDVSAALTPLWDCLRHQLAARRDERAEGQLRGEAQPQTWQKNLDFKVPANDWRWTPKRPADAKPVPRGAPRADDRTADKFDAVAARRPEPSKPSDSSQSQQAKPAAPLQVDQGEALKTFLIVKSWVDQQAADARAMTPAEPPKNN